MLTRDGNKDNISFFKQETEIKIIFLFLKQETEKKITFLFFKQETEIKIIFLFLKQETEGQLGYHLNHEKMKIFPIIS